MENDPSIAGVEASDAPLEGEEGEAWEEGEGEGEESDAENADDPVVDPSEDYKVIWGVGGTSVFLG